MSSFVTVIGTVFVDCKGFSHNHYVPAGRNLGTIQFVHGGVGRNVAENLAHLELKTSFVSTVDSTGLGDEIVQRLAGLNVHTAHIGKAEQGMGMWLAVLDETGNLAGSISQMPQLAGLERILQASGSEIVRQSSHIVLELDLNERISRSVLELAAQHNKPVYGIPGNLDVILGNRSLLERLECFICNEIEAGRLLNQPLAGLEPDALLPQLTAYVDAVGMRSMVITLGEKGSIYYDRITKQSGYQPVMPVQLVDSSGAGDAYFSGTVMGLVRGLPLKQAVVCGTKVAGWTIESHQSNCPELNSKFKQDEYFQRLLVKP